MNIVKIVVLSWLLAAGMAVGWVISDALGANSFLHRVGVAAGIMLITSVVMVLLANFLLSIYRWVVT